MLSERIELRHGAYLLHAPEFLPSERADSVLAALRDEIAWTRGEIVLFGKSIPEPRLTAWFSPHAYRYSGRFLPSAPFPPLIAELCAEIERATGAWFNSVLLNRYRDGSDSMGYHADAEPELGENPIVASLSLGATRRFVVRAKQKSDRETLTLELGHGSLLSMGGSFQHHYRHAVPKQPAVKGERINLTFRRMLRSSSQTA